MSARAVYFKARSKKGAVLKWAGSSTFLHAPEVQAVLSVLVMGLCACVRACVCVCAYGWDVRVGVLPIRAPHAGASYCKRGYAHACSSEYLRAGVRVFNT